MFVSPTTPFSLVEDIGSVKGGLYSWGKTKFTFYSPQLDINMNDPAYQVVYGVGLLDDVHNYFPALLYDQGRFQNITNIFSYVRSQLNTRFNLYAHGARLAQASNGTDAPARAPTYTTTTTPPPMPPLFRSHRAGASDNEVMASASFLLNMLNLGLEGEAGFTPLRAGSLGTGATGGTGGGVWAAFRTPVIVAPSTAVLASNTSILNASDVSNNLVGVVCTICQDTVVPTDLCRRLNACQHVYHKACIDEWFTRSVFCPSCRHDVREPRAASPMLQGVAGPALPAVPSSPLVGGEQATEPQ